MGALGQGGGTRCSGSRGWGKGLADEHPSKRDILMKIGLLLPPEVDLN